jgi:FG-GAP repeat
LSIQENGRVDPAAVLYPAVYLIPTSMRILLALILFSVTGCQPAPVAPPVPLNLQPVLQQFNSGDADGAFAVLDSLAQAHPANAQVYATRGTMLRRLQDLPASLEAFEMAAELSPTTAGILFNLGVAYALVDRDDDAMDGLLRSKDAGFNTFNVFAGPAAAELAEHPRYASLFPTAAEYADPFVEGARIIHDWSGENAGDQFGWVARRVGDVDGDGVFDAASSAPTNNEGAQVGGKIYVYSGASGDLIWTATGPDDGGQLGFVVESAGDVNGDGTPDVIAGAPFANKAWVYSGSDGSVVQVLEGDDPTGAFGATVKGVGDANGDGFDDVLVGEPHQIFGGPINGGDLSDPGAAHVFSGRDGALLLTLLGVRAGDGFGATSAGKAVDGGALFVVGAPGAGEGNRGRAYVYRNLDPEPEFELAGAETGVGLGAMFMSVMGDANGDGFQDFYVSDWADSALGPSTGRIYVFSGATGETLLELGGEAAGDGFGIGVSDAGDVNKDGHDDLVVGAWQHASAAASGGKLYIHSGKDGSLLHTVTGKVMGETLGFDTTGLGDVDGDGTVDFLVTSAWSGIEGFQSGRTLVISGR